MAKPKDVRIRRGDGSEINCDLIHRGIEDGLDTWEIPGVIFNPYTDKLLIGVLPAMTTIAFAGIVPEGHGDMVMKFQEKGVEHSVRTPWPEGAPDRATRNAIQGLLDLLFIHRPVGTNGKHGNLHT